MKFDELRSIAHNIADSLASGDSALVHEYQLDIFGEAGRSPEGFITVDFLTGTSVGGRPSSLLAHAIERFRGTLVDLCRKHGASPSLFRELSARYSIDAYGPRFLVTLADDQGRRSVDEYVGIPGRRPKVLDQLGRVRRKCAV